MEYVSVQSSAITAIGYDPNTETLAVRFKSGAEHHYENVRPVQHEAFVNAPSIGRYFQQNIKGRPHHKQ